MEVDLHMHSIYSDGTFSLEKLIETAKKLKLKAISITDHDNVDAYLIKKSLISETRDIEIIKGIEFSCNLGENEIHILGYFLNLDDEIFLDRIENLLKSREERNKKIIEKLQNSGIIINIENVKKYATSRILGRVHFAKALIDMSVVSSVEEAFNKYLAKNSLAYVPRINCSPEVVIKYIKENGGFASIAHPKYISTNDEFIIKLIKNLKEVGLDGIEVNYPNFSKNEISKYKTWAKKFSLLITGGSDFHGENRKNIQIGKAGIDYTQLDKLKKHIGLI